MQQLSASAVSNVIKACDGMCLISLWNDGITTFHLAPRTEKQWVLVVTSVANDAEMQQPAY
jgi:hypothetical protein